jgi:hypothetical protein
LKNTVYLLRTQVFQSFYLTNQKTIIMQKTNLFKSPLCFFIVLLLLFASCNNNDSASAKADNENTTEKTTTPDVATLSTDLSGNLDTLWIDSASFVKQGVGPRLTFRFYDTLNKFILHGWSGNPGSYNNKPPDVRLLIGRQSTVKFGSGSYLGNLQLSPDDYNAIRTKLNTTHTKYVVFGPVNPNTGVLAGQIYYDIFVTNDNPADPSPTFVHMFVLDPTGTSTNPSPPRNSN